MKISFAQVLALNDMEAEQLFALLRWRKTGGRPVCPKCGGERSYRYSCRKLWKCTFCKCHFTVTNGTAFAHRKLPLQKYLAVILGSDLQDANKMEICRALDVQWVTARKILIRYLNGDHPAPAESKGEG